MKRALKIALAIVAGLLALGIVAFMAWAMTPLGPGDTSLELLADPGDMEIIRSDVGYEVARRGVEPTAGLVFYPGGRVDVRSYLPLASSIASETGALVVVVPMPLSLAVFDINAAEKVIAAHPEIEVWGVGGHSLGGAMAAQWASGDPEGLDGLLLLAAYANDGADMSSTDLAAADVIATNDSVLDQANWEAGQALLPADTSRVEIAGGNHAQFGDYGEQPGDSPATIAPQEQWRLVTLATDSLIDRMAR